MTSLATTVLTGSGVASFNVNSYKAKLDRMKVERARNLDGVRQLTVHADRVEQLVASMFKAHLRLADPSTQSAFEALGMPVYRLSTAPDTTDPIAQVRATHLLLEFLTQNVGMLMGVVNDMIETVEQQDRANEELSKLLGNFQVKGVNEFHSIVGKDKAPLSDSDDTDSEPESTTKSSTRELESTVKASTKTKAVPAAAAVKKDTAKQTPEEATPAANPSSQGNNPLITAAISRVDGTTSATSKDRKSPTASKTKK